MSWVLELLRVSEQEIGILLLFFVDRVDHTKAVEFRIRKIEIAFVGVIIENLTCSACVRGWFIRSRRSCTEFELGLDASTSVSHFIVIFAVFERSSVKVNCSAFVSGIQFLSDLRAEFIAFVIYLIIIVIILVDVV